MKNDVKWRQMDDEDYMNNRDNMVLVRTDITIRLSWARYIDDHSHRLRDHNEQALEWAYIE